MLLGDFGTEKPQRIFLQNRNYPSDVILHALPPRAPVTADACSNYCSQYQQLLHAATAVG